MPYLLASHWLWLLIALAIGLVIGWVTWRREPDGWVDGWVSLTAIAFLVGAAIAAFKLLPNRPGYWLEVALLLFMAYVIGCFLGWLMRQNHAMTAAMDKAMS